MAEAIFQPLAGGVPEGEIGGQIDVGVALAIDRRQAAAGTDRRDRGTDGQGRLLHRRADLREMLQVGARADVHMDAADDDLMPGGRFQAEADLLVPDAVLRLVAAGVRLAAVAVAEARD